MAQRSNRRKLRDYAGNLLKHCDNMQGELARINSLIEEKREESPKYCEEVENKILLFGDTINTMRIAFDHWRDTL